MAMGSVTVSNSATAIVPANYGRIALFIANLSLQTVYIGDSTVSTTNGIPIASGGVFTADAGGTQLWQGAYFGIVASSTAAVSYWEQTR